MTPARSNAVDINRPTMPGLSSARQSRLVKPDPYMVESGQVCIRSIAVGTSSSTPARVRQCGSLAGPTPHLSRANVEIGIIITLQFLSEERETVVFHSSFRDPRNIEVTRRASKPRYAIDFSFHKFLFLILTICWYLFFCNHLYGFQKVKKKHGKQHRKDCKPRESGRTRYYKSKQNNFSTIFAFYIRAFGSQAFFYFFFMLCKLFVKWLKSIKMWNIALINANYFLYQEFFCTDWKIWLFFLLYIILTYCIQNCSKSRWRKAQS